MLGGLITGVNASTPNIPSAVTENVPPSMSTSESWPERAALARRVVSALSASIDKVSARRTTGTTRPPSSAMATPTLMSGSKASCPPAIWLFTTGWSARAPAAAATT